MKLVLVAINAKYIHSNLAVYSLAAFGQNQGIDVKIKEYTINNNKDEILSSLYEEEADIVAFSCYIWNIEYVRAVASELKKVDKEITIWVGGPEVSYDVHNVLTNEKYVDIVMMGEGEKTFLELIKLYKINEKKVSPFLGYYNDKIERELVNIEGIAYRKGADIQINNTRELMDMDELPFVYNNLQDFEHRIIYYETARGCPFSCSYCLSSIDKSVRFRSLNLVYEELKYFLDNKVAQVKFVDRTFNCNREHSRAIWKYILENDNGITNFHFEISSDLLEEEDYEIFRQMREGLIQLEIGLQSTNAKTIKEIRRVMNLDKVSKSLKTVNAMHNIHQHLDLIAGLPYEDYDTFIKSFNDAYALQPEQLQMGFLKVLKGSYMYDNREAYELTYHDYPPYEVESTKWISFREMLVLKKVEEMLEVYYNSNQFVYTLKYVLTFFNAPYDFYYELAMYYDKNKYLGIAHKRVARYTILRDFLKENTKCNIDLVSELMTCDLYLRENLKSRPDFLKNLEGYKKAINDFYRRGGSQDIYIAKDDKYDSRVAARSMHIEPFSGEAISIIWGRRYKKDMYILYDYENRNPLTNDAKMTLIRNIDSEPSRVDRIVNILNQTYSTEYVCYLNYNTPWQLLIATMLSAQCTDQRVNLVTADLFVKYPDLEAFAKADLKELEKDIYSTGFYKNKAKNIIECANQLLDLYGGELPNDIDKLTALAGVGRKTANVIRGNIYHIPSVVVDTHVKRISKKLGLTKNEEPEKIEQDLMKVLPENQWILYNIQVIAHGRSICTARSPQCDKCPLYDLCLTKS